MRCYVSMKYRISVTFKAPNIIAKKHVEVIMATNWSIQSERAVQFLKNIWIPRV